MKQKRAAQFVEENLKTIFAYALSRVSDRHDAEDLTGDIVLAVLRNATKIQNDDAFYGYVWKIAANTYRKFMRQKNRVIFDALDDNTSDTVDFTEALLEQEDWNTLRREIALLSKEYRDCTVAYYYDGLSCADVSKKLGISLEMVKYYLFKTRKILKEGISMEREFGEKSFKPAPFEFVTIFSGNFNREYHDLFTRKLPGQILMSAYYTPVTVRELVMELGVASVYLEDEIAVLEKYNLITKTNAGKIQTNLVIFTDGFTKEFYEKAAKIAETALTEIVSSVKEKLEGIRNLNRVCQNLSDARLLWGLLWPIMRQGHRAFENEYPQYQEKDRLYEGAVGTKYGIVTDEEENRFGCDAFAGYAKIDDKYYASAADFNVLPVKNRYFEQNNRRTIQEKIHKTVSGEMPPEFMILTEAEENRLFTLLSKEILMMAKLYDRLLACAVRLMHSHAPKNVSKQIDPILFQTLFFRTVGFIGGCAVQSGVLVLPDFEGPAAMYVGINTKVAHPMVAQDVLS